MGFLMKRVLFVDDEPRQLERYREVFAERETGWELGFANGGQDALKRMFDAPYDVVVADLSMPEMDGMELLTLVMQRYPHAVRLIVCTPEEKEAGLRLVGTAHQDLPKPAAADELEATIERTVALRDLLDNGKLKGLVSQIQSLPSMPDLYLELLDELNHAEPSIETLGNIISRDPAMSVKLLQLVNSAFFGLPQRISHPSEAAMYVGTDTVRALVLSLQFFALFERVRIPEFSFDALWAHCFATGLAARRIARLERLEPEETNLAFTAGLLHDAGKLVLATGLPNQYQSALRHQKQQPSPAWAVEREVLGSSHAEVGAYLLGLWALPDSLVEALAWHHHPRESFRSGISPLLIVHVADVLEQEGRTPPELMPQLDQEYLREAGVLDRLDDWREAVREVLAGDNDS
jgi:HD-like signal output (HDOD) protein/ActR/RegA family two-component response regulator